MQIDILNAQIQTLLFSFIFLLSLLLSFRRKLVVDNNLISKTTTNQLKGFAILAVVFAHIGYFLSKDTSFLSPLSNFAGIAVDAFLLISGYGLACSYKNRNIIGFLKKRVLKIFEPLWLILAGFVIADFFILNKTYSFQYLAPKFLGIFETADIFNDINSPLWYITIILFFYLIFAIFYLRKYAILSSLAIAIVSYVFVNYMNLPVNHRVIELYNLHYLAFPAGIALFGISKKLSQYNDTRMLLKKSRTISIMIATLCLALVVILSKFILVDPILIQAINILATLMLVIFFEVIPFNIAILNLFGIYSYEIYLLHWPILYRYDILYEITPAYLATITYLVLFLMMSWVIHKATFKI